MKKELSKKRSAAGQLTLLAAAILLLYGGVYALRAENSVQTVMAFLLIAIAMIGGYRFCQAEFDAESVVGCVLLFGLVLRIGYMLVTPCTLRGHDLGQLSIDGDGHAAYLLHLLAGHLPAGNEGQFYHPPLYALCAAAVASVLKPILQLRETVDIVNCARIVSCFFSCATLLCVRSLCRELHIRRFLPLLVTACLPGLIFMAGCVNNDAMAAFFVACILLYGVRWYRKQSVLNTAFLALAFGLGMLTKISVATMALPTGVLMLCVIFSAAKEKQTARPIRMFFLFLAISVPIGMSYAVRNLVLFGQPFGYVLDLKEAAFQAQVHSFAERFLIFPVSKLFSSPFAQPYPDYQVWQYVWKSAVFGEYKPAVPQAVAAVMLLLYGIVKAGFVASAGYMLVKRRKAGGYLLLVALVTWCAYLFFNLRYPYGCTMDFRYVVPAFFASVCLLGMAKPSPKARVGKICYGVLTGSACLFAVLSAYLFVAI